MPASPTATPEHIKDVNTRYHDAPPSQNVRPHACLAHRNARAHQGRQHPLPDAAASEYDAKWGIDFGDVGQDQVRGKLVKALGGAAGETFDDALEIGSGTGYFSLNLVQLGRSAS